MKARTKYSEKVQLNLNIHKNLNSNIIIIVVEFSNLKYSINTRNFSELLKLQLVCFKRNSVAINTLKLQDKQEKLGRSSLGRAEVAGSIASAYWAGAV